ncbi:MAG: zf-TFIIB domain-containing protein [Sandaracinaceae bacterium]
MTTDVCPSCGGALGAGAGLPPCLCELQPSRPPQAQAAGTRSEARALKCPSCGAFLERGARSCAYCEVELASVRCWRCFALSFAGAPHCSACGAVLEGEGNLGATDHACPACDDGTHLHRVQVGAFRIEECLRCTGVWVAPDTLERLTRSREEEAGAAVAPPGRETRPLEPVRYRKCPACRKVMHRQNFGRCSGVIVDVCREDGVFFDADELTHVLEFVARGGLKKTRARERMDAEARLHRARMEAMTLERRGMGPNPKARTGAMAAGALLSALFEIG